MREEESNWFSRWEEELPSPDELMPLSQTLITPDLALAFDIRNPNSNPNNNNNAQQMPPPAHQQPNCSEFADSAELGSGGNGNGGVSGAVNGDEPARTLKRPRLVWTPQLHKRFVDAVAHLGIKNAVPKTIMQLMSVDGLTRENVASHLQKYRLYLKRMQGLSSGGNGNGNGGVPGGTGSSDPATDHLFASSPVPPHFLHPSAAVASSRPGSDHYLPFVPVNAALHHHHHQQMVQIQGQFHHHHHHRHQAPQFEHPFLNAVRPPPSSVHRLGVSSGYVSADDLDPANAGSAGGGGGRKVLTLFPTGED